MTLMVVGETQVIIALKSIKYPFITITPRSTQPRRMGLYNTPAASLQTGKIPSPTNVLNMTLNLPWLQDSNLGDLRNLVYTFIDIIPGNLWPGVEAPGRVISMGQTEQTMRANKWLMLNWDCYLAILETI